MFNHNWILKINRKLRIATKVMKICFAFHTNYNVINSSRSQNKSVHDVIIERKGSFGVLYYSQCIKMSCIQSSRCLVEVIIFTAAAGFLHVTDRSKVNSENDLC